MTNVELPEYRERTPFWRDGEKMQNFGDFLTMFLLDRLFLRVPRLPGDVRIIGSYLDDYLVRKATDRPVPPLLPQRAPLIAWAGGVRRPGGLSQDALAHVEILSVRGPLSAKEIGRPGRIPLGDPGLLLPALYTPRLQPEFQGRTLCVPHFNDFRADDAIRAATGADCVLRPAIVAALNEVEAFLDRLTSASFVLCGSLHAAIAAAAYGIPFAFWESGDIDIPFKWHDFAALVEIECVFCPDVASGRAFYEDRIRTRLKLPSMWEALAVAPYPLRPDALLRILMWDISQRGADANSALSEIEKIFEAGRSRLDDIVTDSAQLVKAMTACLTENNTVIAALQNELDGANGRVAEMKRKQSEDAGRIAALETELDAANSRAAEMERKLTEGVLLPAAALQRLVSAGDRLAEELRRAYARPWRPVKRALQRGLLRLALLAGPALSARQRRRMQRSLAKRLPTAFGDSWNAVLSETLSRGTGQIAQHQSRPKSMAPAARPSADWRRILTYRTLSLLADLSEPFSARRARKFRRSAEKRAPHNFRNTREVAGVVAAAHPGRPASDPQRARRILVSDYRLPRPDVSAGERATVGLLTDLAALGYEVVFVPIDMCEDITYRTLLEKLGVTVVTKANGYNSAAAFVQTEGHKFGAFYLIRVDVAEALLPSARAAAPDARILFHAPDLYFLRETRAAELNADAEEMAAAEETRRRETAIMRASDHVVLVSPAEWNYVEKILPRDRVTIFPALYSPVAADPPGFLARQHVFFLGGFGHRPNVSAVKWFVDHVWSTVHAALPDAEFHIIGAEAPREIVELGTRPGVRYIGYVADLNPLLDRYRLSVVPLLYGAGIKGKLGMALGAGVPTVTTAIGAEGMGVIDGVHALIRDEPNAFAEAVIALYRDAANWTRIARNGRRLVADNFSEFANRAALLRVLESAGVLPLDVYVKYCQTAEPLPLPDPDTSAPIDVSIIIPVHNQWRLTRACLNSVALACLATGLQCEVILADDCSTDETASAASLFPGLRIVRQEVNQGFLRNCNAAAARASGRMLLFLNNDTVVMPNWLTALVTTMEENPDAAIVGSKLLYRDGTIQEAGGVLYSDGSASPVCRGEPNHAPLASYDREVDYCSGASILVRRSFWTEVQGFDERFAPAYCEDSDLAMEARARGMRVLYSARSVVMHLEHGSYDQQPTSPTALMKSNNQKLFDKWRSQFTAEHLLPGTDTLIAAAHAQRKAPPAASTRREGGRLNILYFSPFPSHPDNHGNQATIQSFARKFQRLGHRVHFALLESSLYDANSLAAMREAWDSFDLLPNSRPLLANGSDIPFDGWYQPGLGENIRLLCQKYDIDVVFCSYVFQSKLLEYVPAHILKVIDTHDKMGNRYDMLRANGQPLEFFSCTPEEEGAYLRRADLVAARRAEEADYFNEVTGRNSAFVLPHIEDPRFIDRTFDALRKVGVVASANRINLSIVHDFLTEIMRRCGDNCPFTVEIAGQVKDMITHLPREQQAVFTRPWVRMLGFVPDISSFYRNVDLIVSPVTMGTGINVKTVQAMAFGMPLLTTRIGIKGIETDEPLHQHETIAELVDSLFRLTQQPTELTRLAKISVARYKELLRDAEAAIEDMFNHPKLSAPTATKIPPEVSSKCDKQLFMHRYSEWDTAQHNHAGHAFSSETLASIELLLANLFPQGIGHSAETGCGKSTVLFSNISEQHTVFALDDRHLGDESSVNFYEKCPLTRLDRVRAIFGPTQLTLPRYDFSQEFDVVLIDGPHGFPFPELEYYYFYPHIRAGGVLIIDDVNIPTIGRMADIISEDEMWELVRVVASTAIFRRTGAPTFDPLGDGWWTQRYNRRRVSPSRPIHLPDGPIVDKITAMKLDVRIHGG